MAHNSKQKQILTNSIVSQTSKPNKDEINESGGFEERLQALKQTNSGEINISQNSSNKNGMTNFLPYELCTTYLVLLQNKKKMFPNQQKISS